MTPVFRSFTEAYPSIVKLVLMHGTPCSPRGLDCVELLNLAWTLEDAREWEMDFSKTGFPDRQKTYDRYRQNETAWYIGGSLRAADAPAEFWRTLADKDGYIQSNYGWMTMHDRRYPGGVTGFDRVVDVLTRDPDSRQAVMHYGLPLNFCGHKDTPCTIAAQVFIRGGKLHMSVFQRSCDLWIGLPYDVAWHAEVMARLARRLEAEPVRFLRTGENPKVTVGSFTHFVGSAHVYESTRAQCELIAAPPSLSVGVI